MTKSGSKVIGIVRGRDLHRSSAKLWLSQFVGDDRDLAIHERQQNFFAMQMFVALIALVHRDRSITEHGLGPGRRNRDELVRSDHGIANLPELSENLLVLDLKIGDRR